MREMKNREEDSLIHGCFMVESWLRHGLFMVALNSNHAEILIFSDLPYF